MPVSKHGAVHTLKAGGDYVLDDAIVDISSAVVLIEKVVERKAHKRGVFAPRGSQLLQIEKYTQI